MTGLGFLLIAALAIWGACWVGRGIREPVTLYDTWPKGEPRTWGVKKR